MIHPLRIFHSVSHREWGGLERRVFLECLWMNQKGHEIALAVPKNSVLFEKVTRQGWRCFQISFSKPTMIIDFFRCRFALQEFKPHILNTHGNIDTKVGLFAARKMKISGIILSRHISPPVKNVWYNRWLYQKLCHRIFTTSDVMTHQLIDDLKLPYQKVHTIPTGIIPHNDLPDHETARQQISTELHLSSETRFIGYIGRLSPDKGLYTIIDAFTQIHYQIPNHILIIVGYGGIYSDLLTYIHQLGMAHKILLIGYRDDPWVYLRGMDCLMIASLVYEGIPQVLLQSMAAKCPVIGTNAGGIPEVVQDGETGLLIPPNDSGLLASAILKCISDVEQTKLRVEKAYNYVMSNHTLDHMGEKILRVYHQLINENVL